MASFTIYHFATMGFKASLLDATLRPEETAAPSTAHGPNRTAAPPPSTITTAASLSVCATVKRQCAHAAIKLLKDYS
jgi:hypothetical protein